MTRGAGKVQIREGLFRLFHGAFVALLAVLLAAGAVGWQYNAPAALAVAAALGAALWLAMRRLGPRVDAMPNKRFRLWYGGLAAVYLAALVVLGNAMAEALISDMGVVYETLTEFLQAGHPLANNDYYLICNNNLGLALVLYGFYAVVGLFGIVPDGGAGITAGISFNCLCIFAAVLLLGRAVGLATGRKSVKLLFLVMTFFFAPLYLWAPYFYSDTLCLPFLASAVLLFVRWRQKPGAGRALALGAVIFLGYAVKGSLAVLLAAALLGGAVLPPKNLGGRRLAVFLLAMLVGFMVPWGGYQRFQQGYLDWTDREAVCFPTELWFCYGSHGEGDYSDEDVQACEALPTLAERTVLVRQRIAENYRARTPAGNLSFILHKAVRTWDDGEYGAQEYLASPLHANLTSLFTVYGQPGFMPMVYYCQIGQFLLLALCAAGSVLAAVRRGGGLYGAAGFYPRLSLFGVMLFLSFWETKPRYALHFAPVLLFCAALAVAELAALRPRAARPAPETPEKTLLPLA